MVINGVGMFYSGQIYEESAKAIWRDTNVSDLRDL